MLLLNVYVGGWEVGSIGSLSSTIYSRNLGRLFTLCASKLLRQKKLQAMCRSRVISLTSCVGDSTVSTFLPEV